MLNYIGWAQDSVVSQCDNPKETQDDCFGTHDPAPYRQDGLDRVDYRSWPYQYCTQWGKLNVKSYKGSGVHRCWGFCKEVERFACDEVHVVSGTRLAWTRKPNSPRPAPPGASRRSTHPESSQSSKLTTLYFRLPPNRQRHPQEPDSPRFPPSHTRLQLHHLPGILQHHDAPRRPSDQQARRLQHLLSSPRHRRRRVGSVEGGDPARWTGAEAQEYPEGAVLLDT